ncbi:MAG: hypothetical protein RMJ97_07615 [Raineya sp.]|nr:hypothetical protein [Raineya sp.]
MQAHAKQSNDFSLSERVILDRDFSWENNILRLVLDNPLQMDILKQRKSVWIKLLQEFLQNATDFEIEASIATPEQAEGKIIYTNQDKWNFLVSKYPIIEEVKRRFGLILE